MHYKCLKCNYEFDVMPPMPHPHNGTFLQVGCPICLKASVLNKVCPKCGSTNLKQTLNINKEEK